MAGLTNPMQTSAPPPPAPVVDPTTSATPAPGGSTPPPAPAPTPAPAAPAAPGGPPPAPGAQPQGKPLTEGPVDPELLKKYEANCMNVVTAGLAQIIKTITQSQDKTAALAQSTVFVVMRVEDSLEQAGGQLNLAMTFAGGAECMTDIADAMQKAGAYDFQQQEIDSAFLQAVDQYRMIRQKQGRLDPAMFQAIIAQMKTAQANGTLDQQYPGLTQFAQQANAKKVPAKGAAPASPAASPAAGPITTTPGAAAAAEPTDGGITPTGANAAPAMPEAGQNFPPAVLKANKNQHIVSAHVRRNPGAPPVKAKKPAPKAPKPAAAAPVKPAAAAPDAAPKPGSDFSAKMLAARAAKKVGTTTTPAKGAI